MMHWSIPTTSRLCHELPDGLVPNIVLLLEIQIDQPKQTIRTVVACNYTVTVRCHLLLDFGYLRQHILYLPPQL